MISNLYRIDMNMIIKVADFGLSVNTGAKDYCRIAGDMGAKLPVKWMAPESLTDYMFSEKSDVVSNKEFLCGHHSNILVDNTLYSGVMG